MDIIQSFQRNAVGIASVATLAGELKQSAEGLGYRYFSYLAPHTRRELLSKSPRPTFLTNYPEEWRNRYLSKCYHYLDPVITEGGKSIRPYMWGGDDYTSRLAKEQRLFFGEAASFGIVYGMTIPVHGPEGECTFFTVASDLGGHEFRDLICETTEAAQLLALQAHAIAMECLCDGNGAQDVELTQRERECLLWTAQGKTSWEIAQIIGRSTATVNFHLQKACRKLNAANKVQAAFLAYERRLLG
ncbi:MAG: LuxR family transcriptional regulator [Rhizobiaceae bacterium]|nr:LuxR family transcriptional regulator [Rhizobiaceae bacterium]